MAFRPHRRLVAGSLRVAQVAGLAGGRDVAEGEKTPLGDEEAIGGDAQGGMMMKAAPATALIVIEPDFLFQFFVIALNAPSAFGGGHQILERGVGRQGGQPVLGRLGFAVGPLDQEPLFSTQFGALVIAVGRRHPPASANTLEWQGTAAEAAAPG